MATALQQLPTRSVPESGRIVGGRLNGWAYGEALVDVEAGREVVRMRVTPPRWPFPLLERVTLGPGQFRGMRPNPKTEEIDVDRRVRTIQGAKP